MYNISLTDIKMIEFKHKVSQALVDAETHQKCKRVTLLVSGTHLEINSSKPVFVRVLFCTVVFGIHLKSSLFSLFFGGWVDQLVFIFFLLSKFIYKKLPIKVFNECSFLCNYSCVLHAYVKCYSLYSFFIIVYISNSYYQF